MNKRLFIIGCLLLVVSCLLWVNIVEAKVLLPDEAGSYSLWGGTTGTYEDVNEYPNNDGDATFNSIALNNTSQSYNFASSSDNGSIRGVRVVVYVKSIGSNPEKIVLFLTNGTTDSDASTDCDVSSSSYASCSYYWSTNPLNSNQSWSVSDLTNLQAGFKTKANGTWDSDEHQVSQIYLDVDFKTETKKIKYHIVQKLVEVNGASDNEFTFSIADPVDAIQSAFIEIGGVAQPISNVNLDVKVDNSASTPGAYDKTYAINASGRPTSFKIIHDVTDYFKQFVNSSGSYTRYLHLKTNNNIYLLHAKLVITYTYIIPPTVAGEYRAKAELTSSVFDTGSEGAAYNSITWKGSQNAGKVRFQLATSECPNAETNPPSCTTPGSWNFIGGENCDSSSWYEVNADAPTESPAEIKCFSNHNNKRYFRYKIQLCSSSDCITSGSGHPEVQDVIISWSP